MIEDVRDLVDMGFAVHILHAKAKNPIETEWSKADIYTFKQLQVRYRAGQNVGVRLGKPSRIGDLYLHALDLDIRDEKLKNEAMDALKALFSGVSLHKAWIVKSGSGGSSRHYYFLTDAHFPTTNLARSEEFVILDGRKRRSWEIDLLGTGKQAVLPPSIHPDTGKPYEWLQEPDEFGLEIDSDLITTLTEADEFEPADNADPVGLSGDEAWALLESVAHMRDDHETWRNVGMALKHEFGEEGWQLFDDWSKLGRGYNRRDNLYQWKNFTTDRRNIVTMRSIAMEARETDLMAAIDEMDDGEIVREEVKKVEKQEKAQKQAPETRKGDPDMSILQETKAKAPALPLAIFGRKTAARIAKTAGGMSAPVDYLAGALLAGVSTAIGNAFEVEIKVGYRQPAALWCMVVGPPSAKKSPPLRLVTKALDRTEAMYEPLYKSALADWEKKKSYADIKRKEWEGMVKGMLTKGETPPAEMPSDCAAPAKPSRRRLVLNDPTIEAFMRTQATCPRGFMLYRDELTAWLKGMDRYNAGGGERAAWLESYDAGAHAIDRVKDEGNPIKVAKVYAPILGGIQPERLTEITGADVADDGLQARFLTFWPDYEFMAMSEEGGDEGAWIQPMLENILNLKMAEDSQGVAVPHVVPFSKAARRAFVNWSNIHNREEEHSETRLKGVFGKADGQVGRIALVIEMIWWSAENDGFDESPVPTEVSLEAFEAAVDFREEYVKPMQRRVYSKSIEVEEITNARKIAKWIVTTDIGSFNANKMRREAGIGGINTRTAGEVIDAALTVLINAKWIKLEEHESQGRGRPTKTYVVNERVWELLK